MVQVGQQGIPDGRIAAATSGLKHLLATTGKDNTPDVSTNPAYDN